MSEPAQTPPRQARPTEYIGPILIIALLLLAGWWYFDRIGQRYRQQRPTFPVPSTAPRLDIDRGPGR